MTLDLATAIDCYPAGADADVVTLFLQVQTTSALTALTGTATMRLGVTRSTEPPIDELGLEPILPRNFSGFASLSNRPATTPTWEVVRPLTSSPMAALTAHTQTLSTQA